MARSPCGPLAGPGLNICLGTWLVPQFCTVTAAAQDRSRRPQFDISAHTDVTQSEGLARARARTHPSTARFAEIESFMSFVRVIRSINNAKDFTRVLFSPQSKRARCTAAVCKSRFRCATAITPSLSPNMQRVSINRFGIPRLFLACRQSRIFSSVPGIYFGELSVATLQSKDPAVFTLVSHQDIYCWWLRSKLICDSCNGLV